MRQRERNHDAVKSGAQVRHIAELCIAHQRYGRQGEDQPEHDAEANALCQALAFAQVGRDHPQRDGERLEVANLQQHLGRLSGRQVQLKFGVQAAHVPVALGVLVACCLGVPGAVLPLKEHHMVKVGLGNVQRPPAGAAGRTNQRELDPKGVVGVEGRSVLHVGRFKRRGPGLGRCRVAARFQPLHGAVLQGPRLAVVCQ